MWQIGKLFEVAERGGEIAKLSILLKFIYSNLEFLKRPQKFEKSFILKFPLEFEICVGPYVCINFKDFYL